MKKRMFSFVLAMVMVLTTLVVVPATTVTAADTWSTSGTTHTITTANDLMSFASAVTTDQHFAGHTIVLANDIDMSGKDWQGVGFANGKEYFAGTFDGQGYSIRNISATAGNNDCRGALFSRLDNGAIVKNVALYGTITVTRTSTGNTSYIGSVAAWIGDGNVTLQNIYSAVNIDGSHLEDFSATNCGLNNVGGLVGLIVNTRPTNLFTIDGCVYAGTISSNGTGNGGNRPTTFGGLIGCINTPSSNTRRFYIKNSAFIGSVNVKSMNHFGAFIGAITDTGNSTDGKNLVWIDNCIAAGTVAINPASSGRANYNGYLIGAYGNYLASGAATSLTSSTATIRAYAQNCYYVSANYSKNSNANNTFAQTAATQQLSNRTDRGTYGGISPSVTDAGNTTNTGDYRVVDISYANLCNLTAGTTNFSDSSKWHFFSDGETCPLPTYIYENFYGASAPVSNEVLIGSASDLADLASAVNGGNTYEGKTVKLTADITLGDSWTSIGVRDSKPFRGTFDGQGHTITFGNHTVSSSITGGLFAYLGDGAVVQNVKLDGTIRTSGTINFFGVVTAALTGTVTMQNILTEVTVNSSGALYYSGDFVGFMENNAVVDLTIDSCVSASYLNCGGQVRALAAFVGYTGNTAANKSLTITNSVWSGQIALTDQTYSTQVGGFVGYQKSSSDSYPTSITIQNCVSAGRFNFDKSNNKDWTEKNRVLGMVIAASCIGDDGSNDSSKNCPVTMTNVYYRDWKNWAGTAIARNNMCSEPVTAPVYTNAVQKTLTELAGLTTSAFTTASKWNVGTIGDLPCPASVVTTFGRPDSTASVVEAVVEIGTPAALASFASAVNGGTTYENTTIRLTADIELDTDWASIGQRETKPFRGTFDGNGYTITFGGHTVTASVTGGLFGYLGDGAAVQNVKLDGTITTSGSINFFGVVTAALTGTVTIQNVLTKVTVNSTGALYYSGDFVGFMENNAVVNLTIDSCVSDSYLNCGGQVRALAAFVGYTGNTSGNKSLTITNSVWSGQIALNDQTYSTQVGGFVGYQKTSSNSSYTAVTISDCIAAGKITFNTSKDWTAKDRVLAMVIAASCIGDDGTNDSNTNCPVTMTNVYYRNWKNWAGTAIARNNMCSNPVTAPVYTNTVQKTITEILALPTSSFTTASKWNGGASTQIPCPASIVTTFGYPESMTMDAYEVFDTFDVGTADALIAIATNVNAGKNYSGKTVRLTADINLAAAQWVSIGSRSADKSFCGTFDGQGYTISNLTATANESATGALFGYVGGGAIIKDFSLTGTITTTTNINFAATVINCVYGNVTLQNVRSSVRLTPNAPGLQTFYTGGLVGFMNNNAATNLTIDGCVFDGTLNTSGQTHYVAGILGYTGLNASGAKTLTITNTAFSGQINVNDPQYYDGNAGFIGFVKKGDGGISVTVNDCVSTGKITFNSSKTWDKANNAYCGVLIGEIESGATLNLARFYYTPMTIGEGELAAIGLQGSTYAPTNANAVKKTTEEMSNLTGSAFSNASKWKFTANESFILYYPCPASFPAIAVAKVLQQTAVSAEARDTDDEYEGIRFVGTFYNTAACHNAGTQGADFGLLIISADLYSEGMNAEDLVAAGAKVLKALKYKVVDGAYVIHAVVYGIPTECREVSLIAVPYMSNGGYLGVATDPISYNTVFN